MADGITLGQAKTDPIAFSTTSGNGGNDAPAALLLVPTAVVSLAIRRRRLKP